MGEAAVGGGEKQLTPAEKKIIDNQRHENRIIEKTGGYISTEFAARAKALKTEDNAYKAGVEGLFHIKDPIPDKQWKDIKDGAEARLDDFRQSEREKIKRYKEDKGSEIITKFTNSIKPITDEKTGLAKDKAAMKKFVNEKQAEESRLETEVITRYAQLRNADYIAPRYCEFIAEEAIRQTGAAPDMTVAQLAVEIRKIRKDANTKYNEMFVVAKRTFDAAVDEK